MKKIALTTIEEDFKKIGLLAEDEQAATTDDTDTEETEVEESDEGADLDALAEATRRIAKAVKKGGRGFVRQKRTSAEKKRKNKKYRKSAAGKKAARMLAKKHARMPKYARRQAFLDKIHAKMGESTETSRVAGLIEEVQDLLKSIQVDDADARISHTDAVKGFANVALIADKLAESFATYAESLQSEDFASLSEVFSALAEEAAESAEALANINESEEEIDTEVVESDFRTMMATLLEGLQVYADINEEDDGEDEEEDEEEEDDEGNE